MVRGHLLQAAQPLEWMVPTPQKSRVCQAWEGAGRPMQSTSGTIMLIQCNVKLRSSLSGDEQGAQASWARGTLWGTLTSVSPASGTDGPRSL